MKTFDKLSEQELIKLYKCGEAEALSAVINKHKDKIYTSIYLLVRNQLIAEDIFQDTFVKIIDSIAGGRYSEEGKFLPWAMRIAHNLCMDHFRKARHIQTVRKNGDRDIFEGISLFESGSDEKIIQRETCERVRKLLDRLPEDQREVVIMRHYGDLSFSEIARLTNCSINTALGRMRYGLINIRKMMTEKQMAF